MPHRLVCIAILIGWAYAAVALFSRDVLPDLMIGPPPDLRTIASAEGSDGKPSRWAILVADDAGGANLRSVGQVQTQTRRTRDNWHRMTSLAWFDSGELMRGTPMAAAAGPNERIEVRGVYDVDVSGNLDSFRATVRVGGLTQDLLILAGQVRNNDLVITSQGPLPILTWTKTFPYQPRQLVQNELSPLDRMPALQVGQRWRSQVVSPLTGRVEQVQVSVDRRRVITWDSNPVTTLEVVTHMPPLTARTWVRPDGLVLRQEVPFPFVRLLLERLPERFIGPGAQDATP